MFVSRLITIEMLHFESYTSLPHEIRALEFIAAISGVESIADVAPVTQHNIGGA